MAVSPEEFAEVGDSVDRARRQRLGTILLFRPEPAPCTATGSGASSTTAAAVAAVVADAGEEEVVAGVCTAHALDLDDLAGPVLSGAAAADPVLILLAQMDHRFVQAVHAEAARLALAD